MKPAPALWFKVSCIKTNLPDCCICTQKVLFSEGRSLFWRSKHRACPSSMPAGRRPACQLRAKAGRASSHLAAPPLSLSHLPCEETTARTNANAAALPSCRPARPTSAGPQAAFHTHPRGCHALEGPRAWGWVQDGCRMGLSPQERDQCLPAALLAPWRCRGTAAWHPGVLPSPQQGCSLGSACFSSSSASPWHLPQHPEPNTTRARLFGCQRRLLLSASSPQKKAGLLLHRGSWRTPTVALLPLVQLQAPPRPPFPG